MSDPVDPGGATVDIASGEGPGARIGSFRILREIGEGGFGSVFEAEQEHPVRRRVALKVIKPGMDTREVIARFEAERQALALMDHPHIARVFDAGSTASGRPYFVMELVKGEPITAYCAKHDLPLRQRLELFEQVCAAVQHAHTKGIIHRDLKPNNVLVSTHDDQPFAKVIDFGIAKATSGRLTDRTLFTEANLMMGTPLYMSPEQAEGSADIDTRTDIYALGVILYQLLTDTTPIDSDSLRAAGYVEVQRIIRDVEPPRPSARLSQSGRRRVPGAPGHAHELRRLAKVVRGDLDWIVMKAIEKDRTRRYETANGLAMDVQRYLLGEPVVAAPPGAGYRMRKFVRRHRVPVVAGSLVALALLAGIAGFAWQAHVAQQQEQLALQRADELEKVSKFQQAMLAQVDPTRAGKLLSDDVRQQFDAALRKEGVADAERTRRVAAFGDDWRRVNATDAATGLLDHSILQPAAEAIGRRFDKQPLVAAALRQVLADRYRDMGLYDAAMPLQRGALATRRRLLGDADAATIDSTLSQVQLLEAQGHYDDALAQCRKALAAARRSLGEDDPETLSLLAELGLLLDEQGELAQAEPIIREALAKQRRVLGDDDARTVNSLSNLAGLLLDQGKAAEAEPLYREALVRYRKASGEDSSEVMATINNLGVTLLQQGRRADAEPFLREALEKHRRLQGEEHPDTLMSQVNLGGTLMVEGKLAEAEPVLRDALAKARRVFGDDHPDTLLAVATLGKLLVERRRYADAERLLAPSEAAMRKSLAEDSPPQFALFLVSLGAARAHLHAFDRAQANLLEAQAIYAKSASKTTHYAHDCAQALADLYASWDAQAPGKGYAAKAADWKRKADVTDPKRTARLH